VQRCGERARTLAKSHQLGCLHCSRSVWRVCRERVQLCGCVSACASTLSALAVTRLIRADL
jgi:hypothetical protein